MTRRGKVPPGWEENPTAWAKLKRLVVLASVGLCVASYLTQRGLDLGCTVGNGGSS